MAVPADLPIVDHHCHLSPTGDGVAAARRFRSAGGTHLFLCTQSYGPAPPENLEGYRLQFETTGRMAEAVRRETGAVVYVVIAPFPVDLIAQAERIGLAEATALHEAALDLAGQWIREGRAVALGEVGRPHFPIAPEMGRSSETIFRHALRTARDLGCPVVVHSEDLDAAGFAGLAAFARSEGVVPGKVIKHYARAPVSREERQGIGASYLGRRELVDSVIDQGGPWFFETDYLDDPKRPGAVLDLATIPRRAAALCAQGPHATERLRIPFVDSIERTYGFTPRAEEARTA